MIDFIELLDKLRYDTRTQIQTALGVVFVGALGFLIYGYGQDREYAKNSTLITDRIATTVKVDYMYGDDKHSVDLLNINTNEKYFDIPISKTCPLYYSFNKEEPIDVIRVEYLNGKTEEVWSEFDGLYQKVCSGKTKYEHNEASRASEEIKSGDVIPQ